MLFLLYELNYKKMEISQSAEGEYLVFMYQVGEPAWPFGPVQGEFVLQKNGKRINKSSFRVNNDGGGLTPESVVFNWEHNCVKIRVSGEEQEDMLYTLGFDGSIHSEKAEPRFTDEEVPAMVNEKDNQSTEFQKKDGMVYHFHAQDSLPEKETGSVSEEETIEITQEMKDYYMTIEPACSFQTETGLEYRMAAVDRALGSSFYVLIGVEDQGRTCVFVNPDPYNGSGGESRWITFIDEKLGFSCLSHSAGVYGSLYRTMDGGCSWKEIEYPSARVKLPDGTYYNPFVMPEKTYEKDGILYMEAGQGADGDYYDEQGFCHGLYQSFDKGVTWEFVQTVPVIRE